MKRYLRLLKQINLFAFLSFCITQLQAQKEDSIRKQFILKGAITIPTLYNYHANVTGNPNTVDFKPDFKLSYAVGVQYKSKRNLIIETMFQPYNISFKSPTEYWFSGPNNNTANPYYEIVNYKQYRISAGIGFQKKVKRKSYLDCIIGAALFMGNHGGLTTYDSKSYTLNGIPVVPSPYSWGVSEVKGLVEIVPHLSPYIDICYSYNIIKKISITTSINYSFIYYGSTGGIGDCNYIWQSLLSVNVGLKYNIINKAPKAKK